MDQPMYHQGYVETIRADLEQARMRLSFALELIPDNFILQKIDWEIDKLATDTWEERKQRLFQFGKDNRV